MTALDCIRDGGVLPVVTLDRAEDAVPLGEALQAGGLRCAEITFRTEAAAPAIAQLASHSPEMVVGAGTVLTVDQARVAVSAGARFIVSPGFDERVVDWCREQGVLAIPGVMTPTEIMRALGRGLQILKFFPAEAAGGAPALEAIGAVFSGIEYLPTGGIGAAQLDSYLRLPAVAACGGSWLATRQMIAAGEFDQIRRLTAEAVAAVRATRAGT